MFAEFPAVLGTRVVFSGDEKTIKKKKKREKRINSPPKHDIKKLEITYIQICVLKTKQTTESGCALCENGWRRFVIRILILRIHSSNIYDGEEARRSFSMMMDLREKIGGKSGEEDKNDSDDEERRRRQARKRKY